MSANKSLLYVHIENKSRLVKGDSMYGKFETSLLGGATACVVANNCCCWLTNVLLTIIIILLIMLARQIYLQRKGEKEINK